MGIQVEFNPDLALRDFTEFKKGNKQKEECIPENLLINQEYPFLKKGQRLFYISEDPNWNKGEIPLFITQGNGNFSNPIANIKIIQATHFINSKDKQIWTKGKFKVIEVFNQNDKINFNWLKRIK